MTPQLVYSLSGVAVLCLLTALRGEETLKFNRDIRPILAEHCYQCHGPDTAGRQGGLRLDQRERATEGGESGMPAIQPGNEQQSGLLQRIDARDPDLIMPPPALQKPLSEKQKSVLRKWIQQGAVYEQHWSLQPLTRPELPAVQNRAWARNPIDVFVLAGQEQAGLHPSPEASVSTLLRRLALDLTGLPPSLTEVRDFEKDMTVDRESDRGSEEKTEPVGLSVTERDRMYEKWVDLFLNSPHHGERMAVDWLDAARYADTNGYQVDRDRQMYLWRDWVIQAFNGNMPFDQFTIEQLAGDLLNAPTISQRIATGFHRNHMLNEEGGIIPEEFLNEYCADRVETTAAVWLGQTFTCARCHDHKYDPFTQRDYYGLYAFFHNNAEQGIGNYGADIRFNAPPFLKLPSPEQQQQLAEQQQQLTEEQTKLAALDQQLQAEVTEEQKTTLQQQRAGLAAAIDRRKKQIEALEKQIPSALVMEERPEPRVTHILIRGEYNRPGAVVSAQTPDSLPAMSDALPRNRLGLARWLMDRSNPLPARVVVNRLWQTIFGIGLVRTSEDFGIQGEPPSHPELLDWLAAEFQESGWNQRHILKLIVTSSTYRQSSRTTIQQREQDPDNRMLSRAPRYRLQAEFLRDQALAASGLLVRTIGGPSVKPYHPPGLYEQVTAGSGTNTYVEGSGDDLYRRSLYSYWKRSVPHPAMLVFDAPFRESCTVRRTRTNTPLQALNLMNDPTYIEAARFLAERMLTEVNASEDDKIARGFQLVLCRQPTPQELAVLRNSWHRGQQDFSRDPEAAAALLQVGARRSSAGLDPVQLAAMTVVASTLLNSDEAVMRE